jgi:hypothetical protein
VNNTRLKIGFVQIHVNVNVNAGLTAVAGVNQENLGHFGHGHLTDFSEMLDTSRYWLDKSISMWISL